MSLRHKFSPIKIIRQGHTYIMIICQFSKSFQIIIFSAHLHKICFVSKIFCKKSRINLRFCRLLAQSYYNQCCLIKMYQESRRKRQFYFRYVYSHFETNIRSLHCRWLRLTCQKLLHVVDWKNYSTLLLNGSARRGPVGHSRHQTNF